MQHFSYVAEFFVVGGIVSAFVIATDLKACRQQMRIMNSVWVLTGLWASIFGLWAYYAFGRERRCRTEDAEARATVKAEKRRGAAGMERVGTDSGAAIRSRPISGPDDTAEQSQETSAAKDAAVHAMPTEGMEETGADGTHAMRMEGMEETGADGMHAMRMEGMEETGADGTHAMRMESMEETGADGMHAMRMEGMEETGADGMHAMRMGRRRPRWQSVVLSTLHCGAGCTLADVAGEWFLYFVPVAVGGSLIAGSWIVDYLLALVFGIGFQYAAIRGMEPRTPRGEVVRRAAKADVLSLTAWQAGMYGWMALAIFVLHDGTPLPRTSFGFWFMMQIAMACGFLLSLPVNVLLIKYGIKRGM